MEALLLRLHLAAASRELGQYETAYQQFQEARANMNTTTPLRYVAEAHWGISLVLYERAYKLWNDAENGNRQDQEVKKSFLSLMQQSLTFAENASTLYNSINELSRSALMNCQIALIEQAMENLDAARVRLKQVLEEWSPTLDKTEPPTSPEIAEKVKRYNLKERANIVSASACYLASVEFDAKQCDAALKYIDIALKAGEASYILRRADAYMTKGQILAAGNDAEAIVAFRQALKELERTDRLGAKIRVHRMLGAYLIKLGKDKEGNAELDQALRLANVPSKFQATTDEEEESSSKD
jgi:tetratricopeptide (TPR) repeat protein